MTKEEAGAMKWEPIRRPIPLFAVSVWSGWGLVFAQWPAHWPVWVAMAVLGLVAARFGSLNRAWFWGFPIGLFFLAYGYGIYHGRGADDLDHQITSTPRTVQLRLVPLEEPEWKESGRGIWRANLTARVEAVRSGEAWLPVEGTIWVRLRGSSPPERIYGRTVEAGGYLETPAPPDGPGQFNFASYLKFSGIRYIFDVHVRDWHPTGEFEGFRLLSAAHDLREYMKRVLRLGLDPESPWPSLMAGMLFGYREGISVQLLHEFTVTGTLHLFAVSGQNVGIILIVFLFILRVFGVIKWRWAWFFAPAILMFCLSTGMESSAARALVMILLVVVAWLLYRPVTPLNILGAAALLLWLWDPWQLFDVGFQLSFLVLLGLLVGAGPVARAVYLPLRPDIYIPRGRLPRWRLGLDQVAAKGCILFSASLVAWLSSLPLIFSHFRLVAPVTVVSNFLVVPIAGMVVVLALSAVLVSPFWLGGTALLNLMNAKLLALMTWILGGLAVVPGGHHYISRDPPVPESGFKMTFLSSDRSAPLIFETRKASVLIGPGSARAWEYEVNPARKFLGIEKWDSLWILQGNARSLGGWFDIRKMTPSRKAYRFPHPAPTAAWRRWNAEEGAGGTTYPLLPLVRGDQVRLDAETRVECWWPPENEGEWNTENVGLVLAIHRRGKVFLIAGNAGASVEKAILESGEWKPVDVLVQGGHSSERNLSLPWVETLAPEVIVRPAPGFYPESDFTMEKRNVLTRRGIILIEMGKTGPVQLRGAADGLHWLFWNGEEGAFRP
jgi:competence protein ComEC